MEDEDVVLAQQANELSEIARQQTEELQGEDVAQNEESEAPVEEVEAPEEPIVEAPESPTVEEPESQVVEESFAEPEAAEEEAPADE